MHAAHTLAQTMYQQTEQAGHAQTGYGEQQAAEPGGSSNDDDDVVDAEYQEAV